MGKQNKANKHYGVPLGGRISLGDTLQTNALLEETIKKMVASLNDISSKLDKLIDILKKSDSPECQERSDMTQFLINVTANAFWETIKNNEEFINKLKSNLKV